MTSRWTAALALGFVVGAALIAAGASPQAPAGVEFTDARAQAKEFIRLYETIRLTPEQEKVKQAALLPLPAPCCSENSAYTCCCPCNLSKTVWGLSALLIAEHGYDADAVRAKVVEWIDFIAPDGFTGNVCSNRGCGRPFAKNGCGGMSAAQIVW